MKCNTHRLVLMWALALFAVTAHADAPGVPLTAASAATVAAKPKPAPQGVARKPAEAKPLAPLPPLNLATSFAGEIEMFAGESRTIPEPNVARLAVGNGKILSAAVLDKKEMLLMASDVGVSTLQIWSRDGRNRRIKVTIRAENERISREIAGFLATMPNARATIIGDKVLVDGDKLSDRDLSKIDELAKRYPQIVNFTNRVGWEKMITMDVRVVEFPTSVLKETGLKWNAAGGVVVGGVWQPIRHGVDGPFQANLASGNAPISGAGGSPLVLPATLNVLSNFNMGLNAQLNLMEQNGTATILAQPTLSTRSGSKASFLVGGEFPYAVSNLTGTTILFKQYGIKLEIEPRVDHNGVIRAKIMNEISDIDTSVSSGGGPALRTRKTETEFNVMDGGTIVLSGLLKRDASTSLDKMPLLGDIPILGALFRSKRFQNNETELVVFVTPRAVEKHTPEQQASMTGALERLEKTPRAGEADVQSMPMPASSPNAQVQRDEMGVPLLSRQR